MKHTIGTPLDRNSARLALVAKRNRKDSYFRRFFATSVFSTLVVGFLLAAVQVL